MNDLQSFLAQEQLSKARRGLDELELLLGLALPGAEADASGKALDVRAGLLHIVREVRDKAKTIEFNRDLSDAGKTKQLEALAGTIRARVECLRKVIMPKMEASLTSSRGSLTAPLPGLPKDDAVAAIRQMEIRSRLSGMTDAERQSQLWTAVEIGDDETLRAIASAPKLFALVDQDTLSKALEQHWRRQRPELAEQVEQIEMLSEVLSSNFRSMNHALDNLAGIVADDPAASVLNVPAGTEPPTK